MRPFWQLRFFPGLILEDTDHRGGSPPAATEGVEMARSRPSALADSGGCQLVSARRKGFATAEQGSQRAMVPTSDLQLFYGGLSPSPLCPRNMQKELSK